MGLLARAVLAAAFVNGCTDFSSDPEQPGLVTVAVLDDKSVGVSGIAVDLLLPDRTTVSQTMRTNNSGLGLFAVSDVAVIPQSFVVRVQLSGSEYLLAQGETNDKPVTVVIGQADMVRFKIVRAPVIGM